MESAIQWNMGLNSPPKLVAMGITSERNTGLYEYYMPDLWSFHLYEYSVRIELAGHGWLDVHPGCVTVVPAGVVQRYHYESPSYHIYTHYHLQDQSYSGQPVPAVYDFGPDFSLLKQRAMNAVKHFEKSPKRSESFLWDALWQLSERTTLANEEKKHSAFIRACDFIELNLAGSIGVYDIVAASGISQSHLLRLFNHNTGKTIIGYLRLRRAQVARHLLVNTTLPVKEIASDVGIPDLQHFNKFIRSFWTDSPREIRREG